MLTWWRTRSRHTQARAEAPHETELQADAPVEELTWRGWSLSSCRYTTGPSSFKEGHYCDTHHKSECWFSKFRPLRIWWVTAATDITKVSDQLVSSSLSFIGELCVQFVINSSPIIIFINKVRSWLFRHGCTPEEISVNSTAKTWSRHITDGWLDKLHAVDLIN